MQRMSLILDRLVLRERFSSAHQQAILNCSMSYEKCENGMAVFTELIQAFIEKLVDVQEYHTTQ